MRGATYLLKKIAMAEAISIHTPHAGSDTKQEGTDMTKLISIHTPHAGSDFLLSFSFSSVSISIHTPHAGSDNPAR